MAYHVALVDQPGFSSRAYLRGPQIMPNQEISLQSPRFTMTVNETLSETDLIDRAVAWLNDRLPEQWEVERSSAGVTPRLDNSLQMDAVVVIRSPDQAIRRLAVEARSSLEPRGVAQLFSSLVQTLRGLSGATPVLVVAPWLSARTRELLAAGDINYIDLTGNALVSLSSPGIFISSDGAPRNPWPEPRGRAQVRGPRAARLIRLLADVRPPYGVGELARAAQLTPGYVSRLLDALDREALVERSHRGAVDSVDIPGLLRRWSESYDVLKANHAATYLAPAGITEQLLRLTSPDLVAENWLVTGSLAAVRFAPVAAPAALFLYCERPATLVPALGLLPADEGANVVLLTPFDPVVWKRSTNDQGLSYACVSQVAVDCLTGTGRMPAEGEALLEWMQANQESWRWDSLDRPRKEVR
jgi:hypothetical protein